MVVSKSSRRIGQKKAKDEGEMLYFEDRGSTLDAPIDVVSGISF
jgi:hypothetical protein